MTLRVTETLCPVCLAKVPAALVAKDETVLLEGHCPEHGMWQTSIWTGPPSWESWNGAGCSELPRVNGATIPAKADRTGATYAAAEPAPYDSCPGECGLCPDHGQHTCTAVLEVTRRCNLACPVCFADSFTDPIVADSSVDDLARVLQELFESQGPVNIQLSGGEPTMRRDLPEVIGAARAAGFTFVQVNTNGLRLAVEPGYAEALRRAGLESVFLQFDGLRDETYRTLRGRPLLEQKLRALHHCAAAGLGVVLVPTVVAGVNDDELGDLVRFAAGRPGVVRGLHLQPVSYFGRFGNGDRPRLTMPEVLRRLEAQTRGDLKTSDFRPSGCEHVRCSFRARYWVREHGRLELVRSEASCCTPKSDQLGAAARRAIAATSRQWRRRAGSTRMGQADGSEGAEAPADTLARFLDDADRILCVSGMLFQDAWSIDLERIRRCCVHSVVPGRGLVPFCLWNLTSESGERLYPRA